MAAASWRKRINGGEGSEKSNDNISMAAWQRRIWRANGAAGKTYDIALLRSGNKKQ